MDTAILQNIGLTGAEIKVFLALLELGSAPAGKVVEKSGLQNAVVHRAFHSLGEKGLLTYILEGKIKQYQAIEPKLLLNFIDEKKAQLEKILPELEAKRQLQEEKPQAQMFQSIRGVKELLNLLLDSAEKEYRAYGGPKKAQDLLSYTFWDVFHQKRVRRGIKTKLLFHKSLEEWGNVLNKREHTDVKFTLEHFEALTETIISETKVGIIVYLEKPFGFLIDSKEAAASYKKFFDLMWNQEEAQVFTGIEGIKHVHDEVLKAKENWVLGITKESVETLGEEYWEQYNNTIKERDIKEKYLVNHNFDLLRVIEGMGKENYRFLPEELNQVTELILFDNKVAIFIYSEQPLAFIIKDKNYFQTHKKQFDYLWKLAK